MENIPLASLETDELLWINDLTFPLATAELSCFHLRPSGVRLRRPLGDPCFSGLRREGEGGGRIVPVQGLQSGAGYFPGSGLETLDSSVPLDVLQ